MWTIFHLRVFSIHISLRLSYSASFSRAFSRFDLRSVLKRGNWLQSQLHHYVITSLHHYYHYKSQSQQWSSPFLLSPLSLHPGQSFLVNFLEFHLRKDGHWTMDMCGVRMSRRLIGFWRKIKPTFIFNEDKNFCKRANHALCLFLTNFSKNFLAFLLLSLFTNHTLFFLFLFSLGLFYEKVSE